VNQGSEGTDVDISVVEGAVAGNVVSVTVEAARLDGGESDGAGLVDPVEERTDNVAGASASSSLAHPANVNTNMATIVPRPAADTARTVTLNPGARCRIAVNCVMGRLDQVTADRVDQLVGCEIVRRAA
jgi:hypothetical protein